SRSSFKQSGVEIYSENSHLTEWTACCAVAESVLMHCHRHPKGQLLTSCIHHCRFKVNQFL
ncbi:hypothetical protein M0802_015639, partial [Mischocyttarus mexicanus]